MGALRREKFPEVPRYSLSCHRPRIASSLLLPGTSWLPPFPLHLHPSVQAKENVNIKEDSTLVGRQETHF